MAGYDEGTKEDYIELVTGEGDGYKLAEFLELAAYVESQTKDRSENYCYGVKNSLLHVIHSSLDPVKNRRK
jgi:hypothetical protein